MGSISQTNNPIKKLLGNKSEKNFFAILSAQNAEHYINCMMIARDSKKENLSYDDIEKEELRDKFERYYKSTNGAIDFDGEVAVSDREKALSTIRKLKDYGWLKEIRDEDESGKRYETKMIVTFPAAKVLDMIDDIIKGEDKEYISQLSTIEALLHNHSQDQRNPYKSIIKPAFEHTERFAKRLNQTNESLDAHIKNISDNKMPLADSLVELEKSREEINRPFREANADKYSGRIKKYLDDIRENSGLILQMAQEYMQDNPQTTENRAFNFVYEQIDSIYSFFESGFNETTNKIIRRHNKISSIIYNRINLLLSDEDDVPGMVNNILKNLAEIHKSESLAELKADENEKFCKFEISTQGYIDEKSLRTPTVPVLQEEISELVDTTLSEEETKKLTIEQEELFRVALEFSKESIEARVCTMLESADEISSESLACSSTDELFFIFQTINYGLEKDTKYELEISENERIEKNGYKYPKFTIRKRVAEQDE